MTLTRTAVVDATVLLVLCGLAVVGLYPAYESGGFVIAALGGGLLGAVVAWGSARLRWPVLPSTVAALGVYFLFGTALTVPAQGLWAVLPTGRSLASLAVGPVFGWADAVTLRAPLQAPAYLAVLPYFTMFAVLFATVSAAVRWLTAARTPLRCLLILIGPTAVLIASVLLGTNNALAPVRMTVFVAIGLVWARSRRSHGSESVTALKAYRLRVVRGVAIVIAVAVGIGALGGYALKPGTDDRLVVRDEMQPPFDPLEHPAPLADFRRYTKQNEDTDLFTVQGLGENESLRLAVMDSYDGITWRTTGAEHEGASSDFELFGESIDEPDLFTPGTRASTTITVDDYSDVWLPLSGYPDTLSFLTDADEAAANLRVNPNSGSAALIGGASEGLKYQVVGAYQDVPSDDQLTAVAPAAMDMPTLTNVPDVVAAKAEEYAGGADSAIGQLRNIEKSLQELGYFSHGRASEAARSRAGHGADRMVDLLTQDPMVGDEEQYASAFALMAAHFGYPVRVVMGFAPDVPEGQTSITVTGDDITAWAEVAFDGVGWVPFHPSPNQTDAPDEQTTKPKPEPQPQVRQPPESGQSSSDVLTPVDTEDQEDEDEPEPPAPLIAPWMYWTAGSVLAPVVLYLIALGVLLLVKALRRSRRRGRDADRAVSGAWDDMVDRLVEAGFEVDAAATRLHVAHRIEGQLADQQIEVPDESFTALASTVDEAVFSDDVIDQERQDAAWEQTDAAYERVWSQLGWLRRRLAQLRYRRARRRPDRRRRVHPRPSRAARSAV